MASSFYLLAEAMLQATMRQKFELGRVGNWEKSTDRV